MSDTALEIRPITESDWDRVFEIFRATVAEGDTYAYPEGLTSEEARSLWVEGAPGETVVAERDGVILGTAKFGPNRPARGPSGLSSRRLPRAPSDRPSRRLGADGLLFPW